MPVDHTQRTKLDAVGYPLEGAYPHYISIAKELVIRNACMLNTESGDKL